MASISTTPISKTPISPGHVSVEAFVDCDAIAQLSTLKALELKGRVDDEKTYQHWLSTWLDALGPKLSPIDAYEIGLKLTGDREIQQLNTDYRQQPKPTDVLSFAALETDLPGAQQLHKEQPLYLGDIIISVETAARQASSARHSLQKEIAWLSAHGLLHLLGWDHPDDDSLEIMLDKQSQLLALVEIPGSKELAHSIHS